jgi:hypothetical protein
MTFDIRHLIKHNGIEINAGRTYGHARVGNSANDVMIVDNDLNDLNVQQIGKYPCAAESYIYLYQIYDCENFDGYHYYIVGDKPLHENGKYLDKIVYDTKLNADEPKTAFIEFANYCEPLSY